MKASLALGLIVVLLVGVGIGWAIKPTTPAETVTVTKTLGTAGGATTTQTVTKTVTKTVTAGKPSALETIKKRGKIIVATSPDWPPMEFIDPETNKIVGYEVDIVNEIAKELGVEVEWRPMEFAGIISAVQSKQVDLGVSGFSVTKKRLGQVLFTLPHIITNAEIIMLKERAEKLGVSKLTGLRDLAKYGIVIGTGSGTTQEKELLDLVEKGVLKREQVKIYPDFDTALEVMKKGDIDAVYAEWPITAQWAESSEKPMVIVYSVPYMPVAFIAHKDAQDLVDEINKIIADMFETGKILELQKKWKIVES